MFIALADAELVHLIFVEHVIVRLEDSVIQLALRPNFSASNGISLRNPAVPKIRAKSPRGRQRRGIPLGN